MTALTADFLDEDLPRARLGLLLEHFSALPDERAPQRIMYPLDEVLFVGATHSFAKSSSSDDVNPDSLPCHGGKVGVEWPRVRGRDGKELALPGWEAALSGDLLGRRALNLGR